MEWTPPPDGIEMCQGGGNMNMRRLTRGCSRPDAGMTETRRRLNSLVTPGLSWESRSGSVSGRDRRPDRP